MNARLWRGGRRSVQDFPGFGAFSLLFYLYLYAPILVLVVYSFN
ncbi:spermidine/putrescine ABC transporter permease PotC, partial [Pseudomonas aeruginosa]|nr:spermidine/putrescine ABC transporter permease PotC [Pseudomonas aeruginosa]